MHVQDAIYEILDIQRNKGKVAFPDDFFGEVHTGFYFNEKLGALCECKFNTREQILSYTDNPVRTSLNYTEAEYSISDPEDL